MLWTAAFALALLTCWVSTYKHGGEEERDTLLIFSMAWLGTWYGQQLTGMAAPVLFYGILDFLLLCVLASIQRRNWQWIPGAFYFAMLIVHAAYYFTSPQAKLVSGAGIYPDLLAGLSYGQLISVYWATRIRRKAANGGSKGFSHWAMSGDYVISRLFHRKSNASVS